MKQIALKVRNQHPLENNAILTTFTGSTTCLYAQKLLPNLQQHKLQTPQNDVTDQSFSSKVLE
jgi:hypothetical protein